MIGRRTFVVTSLLLALSILCSFRIISKSVVLVEESRVGIAPTRQMLRVVPLQDLAQSSELGNCQNGLFPLRDVIHSTIEDVKHSRIPPVLHQTGKTRCVAFDILNLTETWKTLASTTFTMTMLLTALFGNIQTPFHNSRKYLTVSLQVLALLICGATSFSGNEEVFC